MTNYYCTMRGTLQAATIGEIFTHSLCVSSFAEPDIVAADLAGAWEQAFVGVTGAMASNFPAGVVYKEVTVAAILDLREGDLFAAFHHPFTPELVGTDSTGSVPTQVALAVSLTAGQRPNGTYYKGRFYLPSPGRIAMGLGSGLLTQAAQDTVYNSMLGLVSDLSVQGHIPSVWSRVNGVLSPVQSVRVGNRLDTIRRRRNSAPETYVGSG